MEVTTNKAGCGRSWQRTGFGFRPDGTCLVQVIHNMIELARRLNVRDAPSRSILLQQRNAFRVNAELISIRYSTGDCFSVTLLPMPPSFGNISNPQPLLNFMAPSSFRTRAFNVSGLRA